jgi:hypothetical protein
MTASLAKEAGGLLTDIPRLWACDNLVEGRKLHFAGVNLNQACATQNLQLPMDLETSVTFWTKQAPPLTKEIFWAKISLILRE